jgi:hypothetical protein
VSLTVEDLERLEPDEPREVLALAHSVKQLQKESIQLNRALDHYAELARRRDYRTRSKNVIRRTLGRLKRRS